LNFTVDSLPNKVFCSTILGEILINIAKTKLDFGNIWKYYWKMGKKNSIRIVENLDEMCAENFDKVSFE